MKKFEAKALENAKTVKGGVKRRSVKEKTVSQDSGDAAF